MPRVRVARLVAIVALFIGVAGCAGRQTQTGASATNKIAVVTTISVLNSFVVGVGGDRVSVTSIVPVGASPETFQPTPQDVATVTQAQLLVENGAGLETWLDRLLANAQSPHLHVVACADGLPIKNKNPHL